MRWIFGFLIWALPVAGLAEMGSLLGGGAFGQGRIPYLQSNDTTSNGASLFTGRAHGGLLALYPKRVKAVPRQPPTTAPASNAVHLIRNII